MPERIFNFAVGRTNPETFPIERVQHAATAAIAREFAELTDYPGKLGHPGLRAAMARRESEREGVPVDPERIALMNGSMQAVTLTAEALTRPGDTVICEEFTYVGTIRRLSLPRHRHAGAAGGRGWHARGSARGRSSMSSAKPASRSSSMRSRPIRTRPGPRWAWNVAGD